MLSVLINLFKERKELELDGYCECIAEYNFVGDPFNTLPKKIYLFYINTNEGKFELIFSQDFDIFTVRDIGRYETPDDILDDLLDEEKINILTTKYYVLGTADYLERKLIYKFEDNKKIILYLYDFMILIDLEKRVNNKTIFNKANNVLRPCDKEKFLNSVVYNKRSVAKPGSLEEKLYHYEDVTDKERELFYKNKKPEGGGFAAAMKSR